MRLLCALIVICLAPAIAAATSVKSLWEMRRDKIIIQEWDLSCGAAGLATLLRFQHGIDIDERTVALGLMRQSRYIENPDLVRIRNGFSLLDLKRFADAIGLQGVGLGGLDFEDLDARAPLLVPIRRNGYNHFVIYRGSRANRILLGDPAFGNLTVTRTQFENSWLDLPDLGRVGFLITKADGTSSPGQLAPKPEDFVTFN